jgi:SNF2 family DNA or RNA helicase
MNEIVEEIILNYVSKETLKKALRIYDNCHIDFQNSENELYEFSCQSESDKRTYYDVEIDLSFEDSDEPVNYCGCAAFENDDYCKHVVACLLVLRDSESLDATNLKSKNENKIVIKQTATLFEMPNVEQAYNYTYINEWNIFSYLHSSRKNKLINEVKYNNIVTIIEETKEKSLVANVAIAKSIFVVELKKEMTRITAKCTCGVERTLCEHTMATLYYLEEVKKNPYYLDTLVDTTAQKKELLATIGLTLEDKEASLFNFYFDKAELKIKSNNESVINLKEWNTGNFFKKVIQEKKKKTAFIPILNDAYICILKIYTTTPIIRWEVYGIQGSADNIISFQNKVNTNSRIELTKYCKTDANFVSLFTPTGLCEKLKEEGVIKYFYNPESELKQLGGNNFSELKRVMIEALQNDIERLNKADYFFTSAAKGNKHKLTDLKPLKFSTHFFDIHLRLTQEDKFAKLEASIKIEDEVFPIDAFENHAQILLIKEQIAYVPKTEACWRVLADFQNKTSLLFPPTEVDKLIKEYLQPMRKEISVELPAIATPTLLVPNTTTLAVRLKEMEPNFLLLQPIIKYNEVEAELDDEDIEIFDGEKLSIIQRDDELEKHLKEIVQNLHPNFATQENQSFHYLTFPTALTKGWFFDALKTLTENNIEIYGQKSLTKFKYNTNKPKLDIKGGSGIDWFDISIELSYGDQIVPLKVLRQAILNKSDFVQLGDGTLGLLPEEWIKKMSPLLKMGNVHNGNNLQVSKFHYTLIDELHDQIDSTEILQELALKKKQLSQVENVKEITKSKNISATLRPYQLAGLNWFNQMHSIGWGGCLADDMGLGKTLQTLCFLQKLHDENKKVKVLIVCPTSLIYNWQAEIDKFTKGLKYIIYHGTERAFPEEKNNKWNILITSYGMLRNSIEDFQTINFAVTILDESQSIKNPTSLITKAVQLIKTDIRFILSGTPVQNNTFDLYAQLNFCNPGLLGSQEFFKGEFAVPIDKYGDKERSQQLRKMVFPFILRRTKEQVAKDLPDKTETVMYCEMGAYQQKVYDAVKEDYRERIMGKIEEVGVAKSAFLILEGLNKLRQICDCPSIIGDKEKKRFKQASIKLDELSREIEENISDHKMLVFSQFLGMLGLIKDKLDADGIKYLYLDGSTPAKDRKALVDTFQTDPSIQIFLISLKAGGVGLNLTAADYVYVVDPWWNPAVEDQAIDRTHRIGQTKKVFAYKMICKNTVEEKILQLQEKKKSLAKELISEDASFVKKLTKDDVAWLLS